jgi:hypothetical protein
MNHPEDMIGHDIRKENHIKWTNPTDGITLIYDYAKDAWLEDNVWENGWQAMPFSSYMELDRKQYFGSRKCDGLIHEWSKDYKDDNGSPIRAYRRFKVALSPNGHNVRINSLLLRREGAVATAAITAPTFTVRWRFDKRPWTNWRSITLGAVGKHDPYVKLHRLGLGRDFEVDIVAADNTDFVFTNAIVNFQEMNA